MLLFTVSFLLSLFDITRVVIYLFNLTNITFSKLSAERFECRSLNTNFRAENALSTLTWVGGTHCTIFANFCWLPRTQKKVYQSIRALHKNYGFRWNLKILKKLKSFEKKAFWKKLKNFEISQNIKIRKKNLSTWKYWKSWKNFSINCKIK